MSFLDQWRWSWRHFRQHLLETVLIAFILALGTAAIVTVFTLFASVNQQQKAMEKEDFMRTFRVMGRLDMASRQNLPLVMIGEERNPPRWEATLSEIEELQRNLPPYMHVFVETTWPVETPLISTDQEEEEDPRFLLPGGGNIFLTGTTERYFDFKEMALQAGSWFLNADLENKNPVVVLTAGLSQRLFGEQDPVGRLLPVETLSGEIREYTVIGVLSPTLTDNDFLSFRNERLGYIPVTAAPHKISGLGSPDTFSIVSIGLEPRQDLAQAWEIAASEARLLWGGQAEVQSPLADLREAQGALKRYAFLIGIFASVGLIIAVINILNLMLARVLKRTKSISLSLALGSTRLLVFRQLLIESLAMGLFGSFLGIILSFGLTSLLERGLGPIFDGAPPATGFFLGTGMGLVVSLLFGVYPAYQASKVDPSQALQAD